MHGLKNWYAVVISQEQKLSFHQSLISLRFVLLSYKSSIWFMFFLALFKIVLPHLSFCHLRVLAVLKNLSITVSHQILQSLTKFTFSLAPLSFEFGRIICKITGFEKLNEAS